MSKPKLKKGWVEAHAPHTALNSTQIEPGGIYRTLRLGRMKEKGRLNYQYGVVKLLDDSTTKIDISFNLSTTNQWDAGGNINPDNGHVSFFLPREEHIAMIRAKKDAMRMGLELSKLSAELDFNKAMLDQKCQELDAKDEQLFEVINRTSFVDKVLISVDALIDWVQRQLHRMQ